jgi:PIN domain
VIVLDTHTWMWWTAKRHKLTPVAIEALENTDRLAIAAITLWEIAMLVEKKRITLTRDVLGWLQDAIEDTGAEVLPLTPQIAVTSSHFINSGILPIGSSPPPPSRTAFRSSRRTSGFSAAASSRRSGNYASTSCFANIPGVYAVTRPVNAEAATVSGDASQSLPGPLRPL